MLAWASMGGRSRSGLFAGVALLVAYALALFHHTSRAVGGSDSSGYLNAARLFARGHATEPVRGLERLQMPDEFAPVFIPLGYTTAREPRRMAGSYPPGMPLHMALAERLGGWSTAPFLVSPIAGLACLVLIYLLGRELRLTPPFAFAGSLLLAFFPTFVFIALQPMSDVLATAWALAAIYSGYRSRRARDGWRWAAFAGLAFGIGVLVRPTNAILLAPLLLALPLRPRSWLSFLAGGVPAAIVLLGYNWAVFGSPFSTGYQTLLAEAMAWSNFPARARHYGYWIGRLLTPIVPIGWLAVAADRRAPLRDRAVLLSWFGAFFLFYCFYVVYEAWWYTRFLLPAVPALILGALVVVRDLVIRNESGRHPRWAAVLAAAVLTAALAVEVGFDEKNRVHKFYKSERIYPQACEMARRRLPEDAVILSMQMSGALHYYTPLTYAMWNWLLPERFAVLRASTESRGHHWYALLAPFETVEVRKNFPGDWREIDRVGDVALWELPPLSR
jgi:Dolichyl-phosphate-mannose-protein mannosyltransferase